MLGLGAVSLLAAVAFPFAPVKTDQVTYRWSGEAAGLAAALPLMPYHPRSLSATIPCAMADTVGNGTVGDGTVLLSTTPLRPDPAAPTGLSGLRVTASGGLVEVRSGQRLVGTRRLPSAGCELVVRSTPESTVLLLDGERVGSIEGDARPAVAGLFTEADPAGLAVEVVSEASFQSTITPLKAALAVVCVLALLGALWLLWTLDRRHGRRVRRLRSGRWRSRRLWSRWLPVDATVVGVLALWGLIGPITVDDGYISGMLRSREQNGFIGNVYRWLNAPEAPFGWFYELYHAWGQLSWSAPWLRLPATVLAIVCWLLLSRRLLPRLGRFAALRSTPWVTAAAFLAWWLPFNTGLRSEPWVAVGTLAVFCALERAIAARTLLPVAIGLVLASATLATSPTGIVAFTPFLAALPALLRLVRARSDLGWPALLAVAAAAPATGLLLMFADQSYAAVAEATRIRNEAPGALPWFYEYVRYSNLLTEGSVEGPLARRVPVLLTLAAVAAVAWLVWAGRRRLAGSGIAAGPAVRLAVVVPLALGLFTLAPTKWTYHFGVLAGVGSGLLVVALRAFRPRGLTVAAGGRPVARLRLHAVGLLVVGALGGLALAGYNQWPFVSNRALTWGTVAPLLLGWPVSKPFLVACVLAATVLLVAAAWRASGADGASDAARRQSDWSRWLPSPAAVALAVLVGSVLLQVGTFVKSSVENPDTYTMANDSLRSVRGGSCGLADYVYAEPDPNGGELPKVSPNEQATLDGFAPSTREALEVAGQALTGWQATGGTGTETAATGTGPATASTPWYRLTDAQRRGELPVVVTLSGPRLGGSVSLTAQFSRGDDEWGGEIADVPSAPATRDVRLPSGGADRVRLVAHDGASPAGGRLAFSAPRAPQLVALNELLPAGTTVLLDWPVAFQYPCLRMPALTDGAAELPRWRISTPNGDNSPGITYAAATGGPFVTARMLATEQRIPLYLHGDPLFDLGVMYRWVPAGGLTDPQRQRSAGTVPGWRHPAPMTIPGGQ